LESVGILFKKKDSTPNMLSKKFRAASTPIVGYIKDNRYIIDLKAIPSDFTEKISEIISEVLS